MAQGGEVILGILVTVELPTPRALMGFAYRISILKGKLETDRVESCVGSLVEFVAVGEGAET